MPRGDVLKVNLPYPAQGTSHAQAGRRPAIAVLSDASPLGNPMVMVIPVTAQLPALRFPHTIRIEPSAANGLTLPSVLLVFQLRAIDRVRVVEVIGHLEGGYLGQLDDEMRRMLSL